MGSSTYAYRTYVKRGLTISFRSFQQQPHSNSPVNPRGKNLHHNAGYYDHPTPTTLRVVMLPYGASRDVSTDHENQLDENKNACFGLTWLYSCHYLLTLYSTRCSVIITSERTHESATNLYFSVIKKYFEFYRRRNDSN